MSDQQGAKKKPRIWHPRHETVLKRWGESADCYRYMHYKAFKKYKKLNMRFTLPIIVIGTVTGTANFAQTTFPQSVQPYVPSAIGALNLFSAIMTTVAQFLKVSELMESHRVSYINYGKLSRMIRLELMLPISERTYHGSSMVDSAGIEYDRLIEQSPPIPSAIIEMFKIEFENDDDKDPKNKKFNRPEFMSIKPIDEYGEDPVPIVQKRRLSKVRRPIAGVKYEDTKKAIIKELEELQGKGMVSTSHIAVDVLDSHSVDNESLHSDGDGD
jgi:hypothetical protein